MFLKVSSECRRKAGVPGEKPAEASMDRKPNAHKATGTGTRTHDLIGARRGNYRCANRKRFHCISNMAVPILMALNNKKIDFILFMYWTGK